jgi:hypothetical protein
VSYDCHYALKVPGCASEALFTSSFIVHIEEFKNMLSTEVSRNMQELTQMREQKRTLELQLSDYFALMAKTNKVSDGTGVSSS